MKLVFVTTHLPPDYKYGGVVASSWGLIKALAVQSNLCMQVIATSEMPICTREHLLKQGVNSKFEILPSIFLHRHGFIGLRSIIRLVREVSSAQIVFCNGIFTAPTTFALLVSIYLKGVKVYFMPRGGLSNVRIQNSGKIKKLIYAWFLKTLLRRKNFYACVTSEAELIEVCELLDAKADRFILIPNGIDEVDVELIELNNTYERSLRVNFMSRISKEKGLDILGRLVFEKSFHDNFELGIFGPLEDEELLSKYGLEPYYHGAVYGEAKRNLYAETDIFLLPSYSENFGNVILEFLAKGIPVITTNKTFFVKYRDFSPLLKIVSPDSSEVSKALNDLKFFLSQPKSKIECERKILLQFIKSHFSWEASASTLTMHFANE